MSLWWAFNTHMAAQCVFCGTLVVCRICWKEFCGPIKPKRWSFTFHYGRFTVSATLSDRVCRKESQEVLFHPFFQTPFSHRTFLHLLPTRESCSVMRWGKCDWKARKLVPSPLRKKSKIGCFMRSKVTGDGRMFFIGSYCWLIIQLGVKCLNAWSCE